ncbi:putative DNA topoisomerase 4 subunit A [Erwinia phage vB_EamM_Yoloswag]|uniref:Putative DNA topoisomerase 4 subunit A n=1 Tax=Erwinia phage vB_EamM_Yoloswag TaxID=1958956 RepID=A0A1S6L3P4_9CAUD|nr:DNA topoisomerase II [Erwinia phage vB_EamM_Yoloswag]AQT28796.1 putative DNA topoisomerase 4 subunit A [Erwinia phage vB_EamM_Yoloswag]
MAKAAKPVKIKKKSTAVATKAVALDTIKKKKKKTEVTASTSSIKSLYMMKDQDESLIRDEGLSDYTARALKVYGSYVVEDRAIADYRDGLKPVHRAILWSLSDLGLRPGGGFKKAARTVGDALGKYHPHGDAACYGAMVTIANTVPPAVAGSGNWGDPVTPAAAMRYTEAKMSKFTGLFLLDNDYLEVTPMVDNFSNDMKLPLYLPALLPYMLFNGSVPPPAYGVKCGNPSFSFTSVSKIVIDMLNGVEYDAKKMAKVLEVRHEFGCEDVSPDSDFFELVSTGRGKVTYQPLMKLDEKNRTITVQTYVPGGFANNGGITKKLEKIAEWSGVVSASNASGAKNKNAGPWGAAFEIKCRCSEDALYDIAKQVQKEVTSSISYMLGVTIRNADAANAFKYLNYVQYFKAWIAYRIKLEVRMLKNKIEKAEKQLHLNEVYLWAVDNMKQLLAALPKVLVAEDPDKALAKACKIPQEDAKIILDRQVRKLAKLERAALVAKVKELKAEIAGYKKGLKEPGKYAAADTERRVKLYMKSPDEKIPVAL